MHRIARTALPIALAGGLLVAATTPSPAAPAAERLRATLTITEASGAVGTELDFTITVRPAAAAAGHGVRLQVMNRAGVWQGIDGWRLGRTGIVRDTVTGYEPGLGRYRVLVLARGDVVAISNVDTVSWTPANGDQNAGT